MIEVLGADNPSLVTAVREGNPNPNQGDGRSPITLNWFR